MAVTNHSLAWDGAHGRPRYPLLPRRVVRLRMEHLRPGQPVCTRCLMVAAARVGAGSPALERAVAAAGAPGFGPAYLAYRASGECSVVAWLARARRSGGLLAECGLPVTIDCCVVLRVFEALKASSPVQAVIGRLHAELGTWVLEDQ